MNSLKSFVKNIAEKVNPFISILNIWAGNSYNWP